MIWAIVLAAGESKRMGKSKLLLPFGKKTIIEKVIDAVSRSNINKILVVLGSELERIEKILRNYQLKFIVNPHFRRGMLSSVQLGFQALPEEARAALVVLGDQPAVSEGVINLILDAFQNSKKGVVLPVYKGSRGHPVLIHLKYRHEIENLNPELGLRELVYIHPEDVLEVEVQDSAILRDIDDEADYKREKKKRKRASR